MSRRDALIREAAAEIDRINKLVGRDLGGAAVPFGVEDTLAVVKLLLAEDGKSPSLSEERTKMRAEERW